MELRERSTAIIWSTLRNPPRKILPNFTSQNVSGHCVMFVTSFLHGVVLLAHGPHFGQEGPLLGCIQYFCCSWEYCLLCFNILKSNHIIPLGFCSPYVPSLHMPHIKHPIQTCSTAIQLLSGTGMVAYTCNHSPWETKARGLQI